MSDHVRYAYEGGVATLTMDDGKVNVMSLAMLRALDAALDRAEADEAIVVLRSTRPGIFSAGFDLKVFAANDAEGSLAMVRAGAELALRLMSYPRPVVGVMEGHAFPMGTFLLLASDIRIAAQGPYRMGLNEVAIGIAPPSFAVELARSRVHPAWLSRTVSLGEMYEPAEALTAGFVDKVSPAKDLEQTLDVILAQLRGLHAPSHSVAKRRLRRQAISAITEAIADELTPQAYATRTSQPSAVVLPRSSS